MPAYNVGLYVEQAIKSILEQTFFNLEIVICDDGSTDNTWQAINSFKDDRVRKFRHSLNQGYLKTYNFLLTQCNGEFVTFQDSDDWSDTNRIEDQVAILRKHKDVFLCACNGGFYYSEDIQRLCPDFSSGLIILDKKNFEFMLPSTMIRREVLNNVGGFHPYFDRLTGGDQYFILEILAQYRGYQLNKHYYFARFNPTSNHRTLDDMRKLSTPDAYFLLKRQRVETGSDWLLEGRDDLLLKYENDLLSNRTFLAEKFREYAAYRIDSNLLNEALILLCKSLLSNPFYIKTYRTIWYGVRKKIKGG
jgi:glycosyltransferase involved in cell wall biosynthesis